MKGRSARFGGARWLQRRDRGGRRRSGASRSFLQQAGRFLAATGKDRDFPPAVSAARNVSPSPAGEGGFADGSADGVSAKLVFFLGRENDHAAFRLLDHAAGGAADQQVVEFAVAM